MLELDKGFISWDSLEDSSAVVPPATLSEQEVIPIILINDRMVKIIFSSDFPPQLYYKEAMRILIASL